MGFLEDHAPGGVPKTVSPNANRTWDDLREDTWRGVYSSFHRPSNEHNRFLAGHTTESERIYYREIPRPAPYNVGETFRATFQAARSGGGQQRPGSAPATAAPAAAAPTVASGYGYATFAAPGASAARLSLGASADPGSAAGPRTLAGRTTTITGSPVFGTQATVAADIDAGSKLSPGSEEWRRAKVVTYEVPPSAHGYAEGGKRAFTQDYRHYKYYGFGGKGAKTSWGHNPKLASIFPGGHSPLQPERVGGTRRPLTAAEKALVRDFRGHSFQADGTPSNQLRSRASGGAAAAATATGTAEGASRKPAQMIDPYTATVSIVDKPSRVGREQAATLPGYAKANVATYRHLAPSMYESTLNSSPQHGSQTAFTQRYDHYKYHGFAGKGATSSWGRNPKMAQLALWPGDT